MLLVWRTDFPYRKCGPPIETLDELTVKNIQKEEGKFSALYSVTK